VAGATPDCQAAVATRTERSTTGKRVLAMEDRLSLFVDQQYINLETYRKSGQAMRTPVWFTEGQGQLYVRTIDISGKVKRIRNHHNVRVVVCDAQGNIKGEWIDATARLVTDPIEAERIERLFDEKYGETKKHFDQPRQAQGLKYATIAIII